MNKKEVAEMADMKRGLIDLDKKVDHNIKNQREDFDKVFEKLDSLHGKFAGKWVEKISIGILLSLVIATITYILDHIGG